MHTDPLEDRVKAVLDTYTLEELLELNEVEPWELVMMLVTQGELKLPEAEPV